MSREEAIFLHIMRGVLWGECAIGNTQLADYHVDWKAVLHIARQQSCLHAVNVWMLKNRIHSPYTEQFRGNVFLTLQRQARLNQLAAEVVALLRDHGIASVLMKGYGLAMLYPDPDMRAYGDVDIYVGEENYMRAAEIVTEAYPDCYDHSDIKNNWVHYVLYLDDHEDRVIEIHRTTAELKNNAGNAAYQAYTVRCLEEASLPSVPLCGMDVPVLPAHYNMLYLFMHMWHHFEETNGVGFRQIGDWVLAIHYAYRHTTSEQWQQQVNDIKHVLDAMTLTTAWKVFGYVAVDILHLPEEEYPLYTHSCRRRGKRLLRQLLRDGHWGRPYRQSIKDIALRRQFHGTRPKHIRILQLAYTIWRLAFETIQRAKLFPDYAWAWCRFALRTVADKKRSPHSRQTDHSTTGEA